MSWDSVSGKLMSKNKKSQHDKCNAIWSDKLIK